MYELVKPIYRLPESKKRRALLELKVYFDKKKKIELNI
jgi:hypothetical protein